MNNLLLTVTSISSVLAILCLALDIRVYTATGLFQLAAAGSRYHEGSATCVSTVDSSEARRLFRDGEWFTGNRLGIGSSPSPGSVSTCAERVDSLVARDMLLAHTHSMLFARGHCGLQGTDSERMETALNASIAAMLGEHVQIDEDVIYHAVVKLSSCKIPSTCSELYPGVLPNNTGKDSWQSNGGGSDGGIESLRVRCGGTDAARAFGETPDTASLTIQGPDPAYLQRPDPAYLLRHCIVQFSVDSSARRGALGVPVPGVPVAYMYDPVQVDTPPSAINTPRGGLVLAGARAGFSLWCLAPSVLFASFVSTYYALRFVAISTHLQRRDDPEFARAKESLSLAMAFTLLAVVIFLRVYFVWLPATSAEAPSFPECSTNGRGWKSFRDATWTEAVATSGYILALLLPVGAKCASRPLSLPSARVKRASCRHHLRNSPISVLAAASISVFYALGISSEAISASTFGTAWAASVTSDLPTAKEAVARIAVMVERKARGTIGLSFAAGSLLAVGISIFHRDSYSPNFYDAYRVALVGFCLVSILPLLSVGVIEALLSGSDFRITDNCHLLANTDNRNLCESQWAMALTSAVGLCCVATAIAVRESIRNVGFKRKARGSRGNVDGSQESYPSIPLLLANPQ